MAIVVTFVGYVEYAKTHWHPEFIVTGSDKLPNGSQVSADTLRELKIKFAPVPSYWEFVRERFGRLLKNKAMLKEITQ